MSKGKLIAIPILPAVTERNAYGTVVLALVCCLLLAASASAAEIDAWYYFSGPNVFQEGKFTGGYFGYDSTAPGFERKVFGLFTNRYFTTGSAAIKADLKSPDAPHYSSGSVQAEFFRGIRGSFDFGNIVVYCDGTEPDSLVPQLGTIESHGGVQGIFDLNGTAGTGTAGAMTGTVPLVNVKRFTAEQVFKNKKSWSKDNITANVENVGKVVAEFTPHIKVGEFDVPVRLSDLAKLFGVHHFNWRQTETTFPTDFIIQRDLDGSMATTGDRVLETSKHIDPIQSATSRYVLTSTNPTVHPAMREIKIDIQQPPDTLEYYWNEGTGGQIDRTNPLITESLLLRFEDKPSLPLWYDYELNPRPDIREFREYRTELVGVKEDGTPVETPIGFTWKSDAKYYILPGAITAGGAEIIGYSASFNNPQIPDAFVGGVFDVEVFTVPEPSSFFAPIGVTIAFVVRRKRRYARH